MLHLIPASVCALAAVALCFITTEAWRDWRRPNPAAADLGWMAATPVATALAFAGAGISLLAAIKGIYQ
jgi:hypothetical protein